MLISGIQKFTLLDYPEKTACIVFTPGCNMRCGYCHNPEFVLPEKIVAMKKDFIPEKAFWNFLESRVGERVTSANQTGAYSNTPLLDGVVISGGEPTMQGDLIPFIRKVKEMGFLVKLDTNGNKPDALKKLLDERLLDYVAMDVKTDLEHYRDLVGPLGDIKNIVGSIDLLKNSGIDYEFRSTLVKQLHTPDVLQRMARLLVGARAWFLQSFRSACTLNPEFNDMRAFTMVEMLAIAEDLKKTVPNTFIR